MKIRPYGIVCLVWLFGITESPAQNYSQKDTLLLNEITFVSFDVETTGFDAAAERILEFGAVKFRDGKILDQKSWLINPKMRIHFGARRVHGISSRMVRDQKVFSEVYPEILEFIGDAVLLAHNATFDVKFFAAEIERNNIPPPENITLDTLKLFRKWFPEAPAHNLATLTSHLNVSAGKFHRGLDDAMYVAEIFLKGAERLSGPVTLKDLIDQSSGYRKLKKE